MTARRKSERLESAVQVTILLLIGGMAGAASFTHVHDWTMANSPAGTGDWFGWANAVISELTPTAAGLEIRRRKRNGQPIAYPMAVLVAAAALSIAAQLAVAKPSPTGWLLAAVPALAFLALSKMVLSATPSRPASLSADTPADMAPAVHVTAERPAIEPEPTSTPPLEPATPAEPVSAEPIPAELLTGAQMAAHHHERTTGRPITPDALADHLGIPTQLAARILGEINGTAPTAGSRP